MKFLKFYNDKLNCQSSDEVFDYLIKTLKNTGLTWKYFTDTKKVFTNVSNFKKEINILNSVDRANFDASFVKIIQDNPEVIKLVPLLLAYRKNKVTVLGNNNKYDIDFTNTAQTNKVLHFVKNSGLKDMLLIVDSLYDYLLGIEVGLDSNARKNRSGEIMEQAVYYYIKKACHNKNAKVYSRVDYKQLKRSCNIYAPIIKALKKYDYAVYKEDKLTIFESNFYNTYGSKLKATAGEYKALHDTLNGKCKLIWITDGAGWKNCRNALKEAFDYNDYIFNLDMLENGILESVI